MTHTFLLHINQPLTKSIIEILSDDSYLLDNVKNKFIDSFCLSRNDLAPMKEKKIPYDIIKELLKVLIAKKIPLETIIQNLRTEGCELSADTITDLLKSDGLIEQPQVANATTRNITTNPRCVSESTESEVSKPLIESPSPETPITKYEGNKLAISINNYEAQMTSSGSLKSKSVGYWCSNRCNKITCIAFAAFAAIIIFVIIPVGIYCYKNVGKIEDDSLESTLSPTLSTKNVTESDVQNSTIRVHNTTTTTTEEFQDPTSTAPKSPKEIFVLPNITYSTLTSKTYNASRTLIPRIGANLSLELEEFSWDTFVTMNQTNLASWRNVHLSVWDSRWIYLIVYNCFGCFSLSLDSTICQLSDPAAEYVTSTSNIEILILDFTDSIDPSVRLECLEAFYILSHHRFQKLKKLRVKGLLLNKASSDLLRDFLLKNPSVELIDIEGQLLTKASFLDQVKLPNLKYIRLTLVRYNKDIDGSKIVYDALKSSNMIHTIVSNLPVKLSVFSKLISIQQASIEYIITPMIVHESMVVDVLDLTEHLSKLKEVNIKLVLPNSVSKGENTQITIIKLKEAFYGFASAKNDHVQFKFVSQTNLRTVGYSNLNVSSNSAGGKLYTVIIKSDKSVDSD